MTEDILDQLRRANPVAAEPLPPSLETMHTRIAARRQAPARRLTGVLLPALGVLAAVAVIVVALVMVGHRAARVPPAPGAPPTGHAAPRIALPRGGMPGVVQLFGAAASTGPGAVISFEQCQPCRAMPGGGEQRFTDWLLTTGDNGVSWTPIRRPYEFIHPQFSGVRDGWADGFNRGPGAPVVNGYWVTHDGGRRWRRVITSHSVPGNISVAGADVWALGLRCAPRCTSVVLHGRATGDALPATSAQPITGPDDAQIVAAGGGTAYLEIFVGSSAHHFVTRDGGRSWQRTGSACAHATPDEILAADGANSLWEQCLDRRGHALLARSTDGGHQWRTELLPFGGLLELRPVTGLTPGR